jgi:FMN phosphatase YigB (HAD superfamily)
MPLTILFDLDDTLLFTNMDRFLPGYFDLLGQALNHLGTQEKTTQQIQFAVQKMVLNQDPSKTLKEVFDDHFYEPLGTTEEACRDVLNAFYRDEYPRLQPVTQAKPEATELVSWCLSAGMTITIATNPLFPQTATRQRIQWAGLDPEIFTFFSSYNDFHFTKPHLAYYAEVLGRLGWPKRPAVMIGDNLTHDLLPMQTMGFKTFWINAENQDSQQTSGTLSDVKTWLSKDHFNDKLLNNNREVHVAILQSTPAVLDSWLRYPPTNQLRNRSSKHMRLLSQILHKLAQSERDIFQPHLEIIRKHISEPLPSLDHIQNNTWEEEPGEKPHELFSRFHAARQNSLAMINDTWENRSIANSTNTIKDNSDGLKAIVKVMSQHDRNLLHEYVNMLNIYKIY